MIVITLNGEKRGALLVHFKITRCRIQGCLEVDPLRFAIPQAAAGVGHHQQGHGITRIAPDDAQSLLDHLPPFSRGRKLSEAASRTGGPQRRQTSARLGPIFPPQSHEQMLQIDRIRGITKDAGREHFDRIIVVLCGILGAVLETLRQPRPLRRRNGESVLGGHGFGDRCGRVLCHGF